MTKKSSGKGKPAGKRGPKDLAPRKTHDVKGGSPMMTSLTKKQAESADKAAGNI